MYKCIEKVREMARASCERVKSGLEEDNGLESPRLRRKNPWTFAKIYAQALASAASWEYAGRGKRREIIWIKVASAWARVKRSLQARAWRINRRLTRLRVLCN
jgi:hypothetical protein